jgi:hypothetical protein
MRRTMSVIAATVAALLLAPAAPAAAGTYVNRIATINPNRTVWEWITPDLYATRAGENLYIRFDRTPQALYIKWVKCGHTATQDAASSVGGQAKYVARNSDFGGAVGTGFRNGACVRIWARAASNLTHRPSYPIEAYLDTHYHY